MKLCVPELEQPLLLLRDLVIRLAQVERSDVKLVIGDTDLRNGVPFCKYARQINR